MHSASRGSLGQELLAHEVELAKAEARESKVSEGHALKLLNPLSGEAVDFSTLPSSTASSGVSATQQPRAEAAASGGGTTRSCNVRHAPGTPTDRPDAPRFEHVLQTVLGFARGR